MVTKIVQFKIRAREEIFNTQGRGVLEIIEYLEILKFNKIYDH